MNLLKSLPLLALLAIVTPSCVSPSAPAGAAAPQAGTLRLKDSLERGGYVLRGTTKDDVFTLREYVKKGATVENWRTLVTVGHARAAMRVETLARNSVRVLKTECPHAKVTLRRLSAKEYLIEYRHNGCGKSDARRCVAKYLETGSGLYVASFEVKEHAYDEAEFERWRQLVATTGFSP